MAAVLRAILSVAVTGLMCVPAWHATSSTLSACTRARLGATVTRSGARGPSLPVAHYSVGWAHVPVATSGLGAVRARIATVQRLLNGSVPALYTTLARKGAR